MATYTFKAVDLAGVPARGELEADSKQAVTDQLRERGLIVLDINEQKTTLTNQDLFERFKRIKPPRADGHDPPARDDGRARACRSCARSTCSRSRPRTRS